MKKVPMNDWEKPDFGLCPSCFGKVDIVAIPYGSGWYLMERCFCKHINEQAHWPFTEDSGEVSAMDLFRVGVDIVPLGDEDGNDLSDEEILRMNELREESLEAYNDEVDHGWEDNHYG